MRLKLSLALNFVFFLILACSMGSRKPVVRDEREKLYRACEDIEIQALNGVQVVGRLCSRTCLRTKNKRCEEWKTTVKNFCEARDFSFFRDGSFVMIPQSSL